MSEIVNWLSANPIRWVVPAVLLIAVVGTPLALWWEKHHPSVPEQRKGNRATDEAALDAAELAETGRVRPARDSLRTPPMVLVDAEESARWAASRMAEAAQRNALFHP
ncbi:hypothetical protein [Streptomyces sp. NPDC001492]